MAGLPYPAAQANLPCAVGRGGGVSAAFIARDSRRRPGCRFGLLVVVTIAVACAAVVVTARSPVTIRAATHDRAATHGLASLPLAAQGAVSSTLARDDPAYGARVGTGGLTLRNAGQRLVARFDDSGLVEVRSGDARLGLSLVSYGYGGALQSIAAALPRAQANRVVYAHGALSEWYANGPLGLEQGFTLAKAPARHGTGPLTLSLALSGNLRGTLAGGNAVTFTGAHGASLTYRGLVATDATGRRLPARLELVGRRLLIHVDAGGARYPLRIDPYLQQAELMASDGGVNDDLGYSVAVSGNTIVVGALYTNGAEGAVYVFVEPTTGWATATQTAELTASDGVTGSSLGASVAISGNTIVAGAPHFEGEGPLGAVYVFVEPATGWTNATQTAKLTTLTGGAGQAYNFFGYAVAISGGTIVASTDPMHLGRGPGIQAGAAYVFVEPATGWVNATQTAILTASDTGPSDPGLGNSLAISGNTIAAGAAGATVDGNAGQGAVFVFVEPAGGWVNATETAELTATGGAPRDALGFSVAMSGSTIVAGAFGVGGFLGAAYVFVEPAGGWVSGTQTAELTDANDTTENEVGYSVAISGDTIVAGAPYATVAGNTYEGATYVFVEPAGGWSNATETAELTASAGAANDVFGFSVAMSGGTIVAGAPYATVDVLDGQGAAYVFNSQSPQTINFTSTPPVTATVGGTYTVTATGGASGNPVTFTIDSSSSVGACSISVATVTFTGAGSCVIDANQAGDAGYLAATQVDQAMTVTVTATGVGALSRSYVDGSAKYQSSGAVAKAVVNLATSLLSAVLGPVGPHLPPALNTALINTYKLGVAVLQAEGWLTAGQAATLDAAASEL